MKIFVFACMVALCATPFAFAQSAESTPTPAPAPAPAAPVSPYTLYKQGKYRAAIREAEILIQRDRESIGAYAVKGWAHLSLRQWNEALKIAKAGYAITQGDRRIVEILGEAHYELGNYTESLNYLERYLVIAPKGQLKGWVHYFIGMIYLKRGKLRKADISFTTAVEYEKARKNAPRVQWVLALAGLKEKRARKEEALATYRYVLSIDANNTTARKAIIRLNS